MPTPPPKHKPYEEWTVEDIVEHERHGTKPVSQAFRDYLRDTAEAAGLDPSDVGVSTDDHTDGAELDVAGHLAQIKRRR